MELIANGAHELGVIDGAQRLPQLLNETVEGERNEHKIKIVKGDKRSHDARSTGVRPKTSVPRLSRSATSNFLTVSLLGFVVSPDSIRLIVDWSIPDCCARVF
jgi:hypothetical protein